MAAKRKNAQSARQVSPPQPESPAKPPVGDNGISLDQLNAAFAEMLESGDDPYAPVPSAEDDESLPQDLIDRAGDHSGADSHSDVAEDACEITPRSIVEALLFVGSPAGEGISGPQLAGLMRGVRPEEIDVLIRELNESYSLRGAPYAVIDVAGGYRLALRPEFDRVRDKFYGKSRRARLSQSAIEVLSLVAYHEPLSADEINRLRGASSGAILSQLVRRELLQIERTPNSRRVTYSTTARFLSVFGLETLADLPKSIEPPG